MSFVIGIDFGGVLSIHDRTQNNLIDEHTHTTLNMPNALVSIQKLVDNGHILNLISFCGRTRAYETRDSLDNIKHLFDKQYYVKNAMDKGKICSMIGAHIMIDDRIDILDSVKLNSPKTITILFNTATNEGDTCSNSDNHISVKNWDEAFNLIMSLKCNKIHPTGKVNNKLIYN